MEILEREISSKLTIKTPEQRQWCRFSISMVNFEHISHTPCSSVSVINFEQVNAGWVRTQVRLNSRANSDNHT